MPGWSFRGTLVPGGEAVALWTDGDRLSTVPVVDTDPLPGRFVLAGLVDAHCHLTLVPGDGGPRADTDVGSVRERLALLRRAGVLALRDTGGVAGLPLALGAEDPGRLLACGRFLAPADQYFPALHDPQPRGTLVAAALAEVAAGAAWVKLVGDFRRYDLDGRPVEPTYDVDEVRAMVVAVHAVGGRVAVHATTRRVAELVAAGVDSVEHGPALEPADLAVLAARGGAWTPTLTAMLGPPGAALPVDARQVELVERLRELLPAAVTAGVRLLTGSDVVGSVAEEVDWLFRLGVDPVAALESATTAAREYLGLPAGVHDGAADLVTYDADPREDPEVLRRPAAVLLAGVRLL